MRWPLVIVAAGCWSSSEKQPSPVAKPVPAPVKRVEPQLVEFDWPAMIGVPEDEGYQRIAALVGVDDLREIRDHGIDVGGSGGQITSIVIHVRDERGQFAWPPYRGPLFEGLRLTMTRDEVIARLGPPTEKKVGNNWNWLHYVRPTVKIQFQFSFRDNRLETIFLDAP
jgi:hypothetical protein